MGSNLRYFLLPSFETIEVGQEALVALEVGAARDRRTKEESQVGGKA